MKSPSSSPCLALALACALAGSSHAAPVLVPDDFPTIQQAVDAADTVHVRPGLYPERPRLPGDGRVHLLRSFPSSGRVVVEGSIYDGVMPGTIYKIQGIEFTRPVELETRAILQRATFERCRFDSGLVQTLWTNVNDWDSFSLVRCMVRGDFTGSIESAHFEQDTLIAGGISITGTHGCKVVDCVFRGPGQTALFHTGSGTLRAFGNSIEGYDYGIRVAYWDEDVEARGNVIRDCSTAGIHLLHSNRVTIVDNQVFDCGVGIFANASHDLLASGNRVLRSAGVGISLSTTESDRSMDVHHNVAGRNGGAGIVTRGNSQGRFANNTSYLNLGDGFQLHHNPKWAVFIHNNVAFGNGGVGLTCNSGRSVTIGCNDWFGNAGGEVVGVARGLDDIAVDPLFCEVALDSVTLLPKSPLLGLPGCDNIGALGIGCGDPFSPVIVATPCDPAGWAARPVAGGSAEITSAYAHSTGSLELRGSGAVFTRSPPTADPLAMLTALGIDLYRSSISTAAGSVAPAVRLLVDDGAGRTSYLVWDPAHNGTSTFPTDDWRSFDLTAGIFWQQTIGPERSIDVGDRRLSDWLEPGTVTDADGDVSTAIGPNARVIAYEIAVSVDGAGSFEGAADRFRIAFGDRDTTFDFETGTIASLALSAIPMNDCGILVLKATVTPAGVHGAIEFFDGPTSLGTAALANIGEARLLIRGLVSGSHRFTASSGRPPCSVRSDTLAHVVSATSTTTRLLSNRNPAKLGDHVTLTARTTPVYSTGSVEFFDGSTSLGAVALAAGSASLTVPLAEGTHALRASYSGDGCHDPSASALLGQIVGDPPVLSVDDPSASEGDAGPGALVFTVSLSSWSTDTVRVDFTTRDGTATLADHDYEAAGGTLRFLPGETRKSLAVRISGDVQFEDHETLVLALSNPMIAWLGDSLAVGTLLDDDRPRITIVGPSGAQYEGARDTSFTFFKVALSKDCSVPVSVDYQTHDGTATAAGHDYVPTAGTLVFDPGTTVNGFLVGVLGDSIYEDHEAFSVVLTAPVNGTILAGIGTAMIRNDDLFVYPALVLDDAVQTEGDSGNTMLSFRVHLSRPSFTDPVTVGFGTIDGEAIAGLDFGAAYGRLIIPPMSTEGWIQVPIRGDTECEELDETFVLRLSRPVNGVLLKSLATGTIVDDDCITPTLVSLFDAESVADGIALRWRLASAAAAVSLERGSAVDGPWVAIAAEIGDESGTVVALDRAVAAGVTYWYRLVVRTSSGDASRFGPIEVTAAERITEFALGRVTPNPTFGPVRIEFRVPREARVRLGILDVQGREIAVLTDQRHRPGVHVATWNGESDQGPVPAGLFLVRYRAEGRSWIHRLVVIR